MTQPEQARIIISREHRDFTQTEQKSYVKLCAKRIANYLHEATGFSEAKIEGAEARIETFAAEIKYTISCDFEVSDEPGKTRPSRNTEIFDDEDELAENAENQRRNDLNSETLRRKIENALRNTEYGRITVKTTVYRNPSDFMCYKTCEKCGGMGITQCEKCGGSGEVVCSRCRGEGIETCSRCGGKGYIAYGGMVKKGTTETRVPCTFCYQRGFRECSDCHGRKFVTCKTCGGRGELHCAECNATGWITQTVRTYLSAEPAFSVQYLKSASESLVRALNITGAEKLGGYCEVSLCDSFRNQDGSFSARYICRVPLAEVSVNIKGQSSRWLMFGKSAEVIDAGGAMDSIMEEKTAKLESCTASMSSPYADASEKISVFISYDINKRIIEENIEEEDFDIIRAKLNNSVSKQYISRAVEAMSSAFGKVQEANRKIFSVSVTILSLLISYFMSDIYRDLARESASFLMYIFAGITIYVTSLLMAWILNKWYRLEHKDILRAWSESKGLKVQGGGFIQVLKMCLPAITVMYLRILFTS